MLTSLQKPQSRKMFFWRQSASFGGFHKILFLKKCHSGRVYERSYVVLFYKKKILVVFVFVLILMQTAVCSRLNLKYLRAKRYCQMTSENELQFRTQRKLIHSVSSNNNRFVDKVNLSSLCSIPIGKG